MCVSLPGSVVNQGRSLEKVTIVLTQVKKTIETLSANNWVIFSDGGQPQETMPREDLCIYSCCLSERGITARDIKQLVKTNLRELLVRWEAIFMMVIVKRICHKSVYEFCSCKAYTLTKEVYGT
jgi:hypothetical protein